MPYADDILNIHIPLLDSISKLTNSGVTVYDNLTGTHAYVSANMEKFYGARNFDKHDHSPVLDIIPEDREILDKLGPSALDYIKTLKQGIDIKQVKYLSEYRIRIDTKTVRVIEQHQVLELTDTGEIWLTLGVLDISPNQNITDAVECRLLDSSTGKIYKLEQWSANNQNIQLSEREKTVLKLAGEGMLSKEISDRLHISTHTVNTHRQRILRKLNANNTVEALNYASKLGLLE